MNLLIKIDSGSRGLCNYLGGLMIRIRLRDTQCISYGGISYIALNESGCWKNAAIGSAPEARKLNSLPAYDHENRPIKL